MAGTGVAWRCGALVAFQVNLFERDEDVVPPKNGPFQRNIIGMKLPVYFIGCFAASGAPFFCWL